MKREKPAIRITIEGGACAGKSFILHDIALALMERDYNVECFDGSPVKIAPRAHGFVPDRRLVRLSTRLGGQEVAS